MWICFFIFIIYRSISYFPLEFHYMTLNGFWSKAFYFTFLMLNVFLCNFFYFILAGASALEARSCFQISAFVVNKLFKFFRISGFPSSDRKKTTNLLKIGWRRSTENNNTTSKQPTTAHLFQIIRIFLAILSWIWPTSENWNKKSFKY